jgi:molybdenum cofactor guanylyltransferase
MSRQNTVAGVVLAGGLARRMGQSDKGLLLFKQQPLVSYAVTAMAPLVDELFISANRNLNAYRQFGYPVISDATPDFDGPLAGILAAMQATQAGILLVMPCDSPLIESVHLQQLLAGVQDEEVDISVSFDGERLHPLCAALRIALRDDLQDYLASGARKVQNWYQRHRLLKVVFDDAINIFANINSLDQLESLEKQV